MPVLYGGQTNREVIILLMYIVNKISANIHFLKYMLFCSRYSKIP